MATPVLQIHRCSKKIVRGGLMLPTQCLTCARRADKEVCRFQNFRLVHPESQVATFQQMDPSNPFVFKYPFKYDVQVRKADLLKLQYQLAGQFRPIVVRMVEHEGTANLIRTYPAPEHRINCDTCATPIFSSSFFCVDCGLEVCPSCNVKKETIGVRQSCHANRKTHQFRPVTRLPAGEVQRVLVEVDKILESPPPPAPDGPFQAKALIANANESRITPQLTWGQHEAFEILWARDIPVVITNVHSRLKGQWTPAAFIDSHGKEHVSVISTQDGRPSLCRTTVEEFFTDFVKDDITRGHTMKVKDWPPTSNFRDAFRQYYESFVDAVPMPSFTRDDGYKNLAAHYPLHAQYPFSPDSTKKYSTFKPDLGPKMYIATKDIGQHGSTPLHLDATSAVNILTHAEPDPLGNNGGARWLIFRREDTGKLREYLLENGDWPSADPIHARSVYITQEMQEALAKSGIRPYEIYQKAGQAVFIPAGCAHQVSNESGCIKIATDFLCVEGIAATIEVSEELRREQEEGLVSVEAMLWHAWASIHRQIALAPEPTPELNKTQKKRKAQRTANHAKGKGKKVRKGHDVE